ncbi:Uncharacterized protein Fot_19382 [Forsythia ovata]|uniref:Uncharacterized protein n=1 Tax=Forsythia ovata TaxID=205694 RepID=A0ABD1VKV9_9LAMI
MRSVNALQSKHEELVSDQFKMKMEIHNLFTDFAKSIVDGIEAVTSLVGVDQLDYISSPQPEMQNDENHQTTILAIQDSSVGSPQRRSKKCRKICEDIQSNDKVGNEINSSAPISLLNDEIVFSEEDFRHMDELVEKSRCRGQKRPAKATTPIPLNFEYGITPAPQKRTTKPAACIRSSFVRSFHSQLGNSSQQLPTSFQYKICMESLKFSDVQAFLKWNNIGLRPSNK